MEMKNRSVPFSSTTSRPLANFHPSVWGNCFLSYTPQSTGAQEEQLVEELKEEVKSEMKEASNDYMTQLRMVDAIQRLGIAYHFEEEIDQALHNLFEQYHDYCRDSHDMYTVALSFRLLRQHGYRVSCKIFEKFKDVNGEFKVPNIHEVMGMLEFYEATYLRVHDEEVLDQGFIFTRNYLEFVLPTLSDPTAQQVHHALNQYPNRRGLTRLEARRYISIYHQDASHHQGLLRLAKSDFNLLQSLHKRELSELYRWWKGLDVATSLPYARDRLVECYFWISGVYFEPQFGLARKILTRFISLASIIDDTYDAYGIFEELQIFTEAVERWSMSSLDQLPAYMKLFYEEMLRVYEEIEEELIKQGRSYRLSYGIEAMKDLVRHYFVEAKWREERYRPKTEEYLRVATKSCGYTSLIIMSFLGMGDVATREAFDWVLSEPNMVRAASVICRLTADIVGHQFERKREHIPSCVECYTEEHVVTEEETTDELKSRIERAWKDINEGFLKPTEVPETLLHRVLNLVRVIEVMYSKGDWYTHVGPEMLSFITQLFIDPLPQ